jgi:hypothetical protein
MFWFVRSVGLLVVSLHLTFVAMLLSWNILFVLFLLLMILFSADCQFILYICTRSILFCL